MTAVVVFGISMCHSCHTRWCDGWQSLANATRARRGCSLYGGLIDSPLYDWYREVLYCIVEL